MLFVIIFHQVPQPQYIELYASLIHLHLQSLPALSRLTWWMALLLVQMELLGCCEEKKSLRSHKWMGFNDKLHWWCQVKGFPFKLPSLSTLPCKKSNPVFSRARMRPLPQISVPCSSPVQHLASLACVPSCSLLHGGQEIHGPYGCLRPHDYGERSPKCMGKCG